MKDNYFRLLCFGCAAFRNDLCEARGKKVAPAIRPAETSKKMCSPGTAEQERLFVIKRHNKKNTLKLSLIALKQ